MTSIGIAAIAGMCLYRKGLRTGERDGRRQALRAVSEKDLLALG
jgi:hypothetical protein